MTLGTPQSRQAGYEVLIKIYDLSAVLNWHSSSVVPTGELRYLYNIET